LLGEQAEERVLILLCLSGLKALEQSIPEKDVQVKRTGFTSLLKTHLNSLAFM
jgi:hypothetical protein